MLAVDAVPPGATATERVFLSDTPNAIYFAFMTLATQAFGDYVPTDDRTRFLVSWELLTTILLVFLILPLVLSKVGSYTIRAPSPAPAVPVAPAVVDAAPGADASAAGKEIKV